MIWLLVKDNESVKDNISVKDGLVGLNKMMKLSPSFFHATDVPFHGLQKQKKRLYNESEKHYQVMTALVKWGIADLMSAIVQWQQEMFFFFKSCFIYIGPVIHILNAWFFWIYEYLLNLILPYFCNYYSGFYLGVHIL